MNVTLLVFMFIVVGLPMVIALVAILTEHQRKMARLLAELHGTASDEQVRKLEGKIDELSALVHEQAIAIDNLASLPPTPQRLQERVNV